MNPGLLSKSSQFNRAANYRIRKGKVAMGSVKQILARPKPNSVAAVHKLFDSVAGSELYGSEVLGGQSYMDKAESLESSF
jgi:hypothetical protein